MHFDVLLSAGMLSINTVGAPGAHGAGITGAHTPGVNTGPFQLEGLEWALAPRQARWLIAPYEAQGPRLTAAFDGLLRDLLSLPWRIPYGRGEAEGGPSATWVGSEAVRGYATTSP